MVKDRKMRDLKLMEVGKQRFESQTLQMIQDQQNGVIKLKKKGSGASNVVSKSHSQVQLKTRLQRLEESERLQRRKQLGMCAESTEITKREELDLKKHNNVRTMKKLHEKRFELDTKDIRDKTVSGQNKLMTKNAKTNANQRYREPEKASIYDLQTDNNEKAKTKRHLSAQRKHHLMTKNQATFGKQKDGLHGKPLPNFSYKSQSEAKIGLQPDQQQEQQKTVNWWTKQDSYVE